MKTIIHEAQEDETLEISDDSFAMDGWLRLTITDSMTGMIQSIEVRLEELLPAIIGFDSKESRKLSRKED